RAAVALGDLAAHGVVLAVHADPRRALDDDRDRQGRDVGGVAQPDLLLVEPGGAGADDGGDGDAAGASAAARVGGEADRRGAGVRLPAVRVTVTVAGPVVAVAEAVKVRVLLLPVAEAGLKLAVRPVGSPEADRATAAVKLVRAMPIVLAAVAPWVTLTLAGL